MNCKKLLALSLALLMTLSVAACGTKDTSWVAKTGDTTVTPGMYLTYLMMGINDAATKAENPDDPLKGDIEGVSASQYVEDMAKKEVTKLAGINKKFAELGLELSEEDVTNYKEYANYLYSMGEDYYKALGISLESVEAINEASMKTVLIFNNMYGEGGEKAVSDEEYEKIFAENYYRTRYMIFPKVDFTTYTPFDEEQLAKAKADAQSYYDRAVAGEDFVGLMYEIQVASAQAEEGAETPERLADDQYEYVLRKNDTSVPPAYLENVEKAKEGDIFTFEDDYYYYVVNRMEIAGTSQEVKDSFRMALIQELKYEEFMADLESWGSDAEIKYNADALKAYTPEKVQKDTEKYMKSLESSSSSASSSPSSTEASSSEASSESSSEAASESSTSVSQ
ncbi:MAG: hypothetical protein VB100_01630 [Angelakisella sp.]|nr:hypothetical protein [Angelakisella sp.]